MIWTRLFIPTLREEPPGATAGMRRLMRAGYARESGFLFLGQKSIGKIAAMLRREMESLGAQAVMLDPFREAAVAVATHDLRSYRQLPQTWFQRTAARHQSCRFDLKSADNSAYWEAYRRVLERCGLRFIAAAGELLALSENGDQLLTRGENYESNRKFARAAATAPVIPDPEGDLDPEEFYTPGQKTIADIARFTGRPETSQMKSLVMVGDGAPFLILVRGDHTLNEFKFRARLGVSETRPAIAEEIRRWFGADAGSLGPVGVTALRILADEALRGRRNLICGANRNDFHLKNVTPGEDFHADFLDLRMVVEGDPSLVDGAPLRFERAFTLASLEEVQAAGLHVSSETGQEVEPRISRVEFFCDRVLAAAAEQSGDADGLALPPLISPADVVITPVNMKDAAQRGCGELLHARMEAAGLDPLLDDRDERPGVKFKDADLIGVPFRVTIGKKLAQGMVEVVERRTRQGQDVAVDDVPAFLVNKINL